MNKAVMERSDVVRGPRGSSPAEDFLNLIKNLEEHLRSLQRMAANEESIENAKAALERAKSKALTEADLCAYPR